MEVGAHRVGRKLVGLKNPVHGCCQVIQCVQQRSVQVEYDRFEIFLRFRIQKWILENVGRVTGSIVYDQLYEFLIEIWKWVSIRKSKPVEFIFDYSQTPFFIHHQ